MTGKFSVKCHAIIDRAAFCTWCYASHICLTGCNRHNACTVVLIIQRTVFVTDNTCDAVLLSCFFRCENFFYIRSCLSFFITDQSDTTRILVISCIQINTSVFFFISGWQKYRALWISFQRCFVDLCHRCRINHADRIGSAEVTSACHTDIDSSVVYNRCAGAHASRLYGFQRIFIKGSVGFQF